MKGKLWLIVLAIVLVAGLVVTSCAKPTTPTTTAPTGTKPTATTPTATTPTTTAPSPTQAKVFKWKMQSMFNTPERTWQTGSVEFAELVNEMSDGRIQIEIFPAGTIVPTTELADACGKGVLDIIHFHLGYLVGKDLGYGFLGYLPGGFDRFEDLDYWVWERGGVDIIREMTEPLNIWYVSNLGLDENENLWSSVPIRTWDDAKGLKMRSSGVAGQLYTELGLSIVSLPSAEVYDALSKGVVDCAEYGNNTQMKDLGTQEVAKYLISPMIHQMSTNTEIHVNVDRWNELPDDLKAIVYAAARTQCWRQVHVLHTDELTVNQYLKDYGVEFIELSDADYQKEIQAAEKVWSNSAKASANALRILESMTDYLKEIGYLPADYQL